MAGQKIIRAKQPAGMSSKGIRAGAMAHRFKRRKSTLTLVKQGRVLVGKMRHKRS